MSHISTGIFGALAVSLTFGAIQLASGSDLSNLHKDPAASPIQINSDAVNREAKADRGMMTSASSGRSQTLSFRVNGLSDTSVLMRWPAVRPSVQAGIERAPSRATLPRTERKPTIACEPVVSVLTDVAKLLQPGRCIT